MHNRGALAPHRALSACGFCLQPAQGETSYAADEEYKDDVEPEPEREPSRKALTELEDENSYADDFEQSLAPGASRVADDDEVRCMCACCRDPGRWLPA